MSASLRLIVGEDPIAFSQAVLKDLELARERGETNLSAHYRLVEIGLRAVLDKGEAARNQSPSWSCHCLGYGIGCDKHGGAA